MADDASLKIQGKPHSAYLISDRARILALCPLTHIPLAKQASQHGWSLGVDCSPASLGHQATPRSWTKVCCSMQHAARRLVD